MKKALNIVLGLLFAVTAGFVAWAVISSGNEVAISWNLMWFYSLLVGAVVCILCGAVANLIQTPAGLKKTGLAVLIVLAVVGGAVGIAVSNGSEPIPSAEGGFFEDPFELAISEVGLLVTYAVAAASILATVVAEVRNLFK